MKPENCSSCGVRLTTGTRERSAVAAANALRSSTCSPARWMSHLVHQRCSHRRGSMMLVAQPVEKLFSHDGRYVHLQNDLNASASLSRPRQPVTEKLSQGERNFSGPELGCWWLVSAAFPGRCMNWLGGITGASTSKSSGVPSSPASSAER